jgi:hypothetical protein
MKVFVAVLEVNMERVKKVVKAIEEMIVCC